MVIREFWLQKDQRDGGKDASRRCTTVPPLWRLRHRDLENQATVYSVGEEVSQEKGQEEKGKGKERGGKNRVRLIWPTEIALGTNKDGACSEGECLVEVLDVKTDWPAGWLSPGLPGSFSTISVERAGVSISTRHGLIRSLYYHGSLLRWQQATLTLKEGCSWHHSSSARTQGQEAPAAA